MSTLAYFLSGAMALGNWAIGLIFYRFWRRTADRLLLMFALAFWALAIERLLLAWAMEQGGPRGELTPLVYLARVAAFLLIVWGILEKNKRP